MFPGTFQNKQISSRNARNHKLRRNG